MKLELWAGAECTVNRVGERYFDQIVRTGHHERDGDIELLAALGVRRVRFPVLWERVAPESLKRPDFSWCDRRLERLRELGIEPIVGLVHHGSGPRYATIDSAAFASGLAEFAALVAERYPWVNAYTPVNEPLTTARFCGLYGHWFPHGRDTARFLALLLHEVQATAAAMERIRERAPHAQLIQTEDLGRTFSTRRLAHQSRYENHRRWLSLDLLTGRVDRDHVMYRHLVEHGVPRSALAALVARPCPPDVVGVNYYVTSDRYLDQRVELYPPHTHGGNGRERYADVEAVRVRGQAIAGHATVLAETYARYRRPLALTEVHLGCTREEQLRWLQEAWSAAESCARRGVDVRAVTLWSAFGACDWSSLLTREDCAYEVGAFDARCSPPRATALAVAARALAADERLDHPALSRPGWWRSPARVVYPRPVAPRERAPGRAERCLLAVGDGVLSAGLGAIAALRGFSAACANSVRAACARLRSERPWAVLLDAGGSAALAPAFDPDAISDLARACRECGTTLALCTSDRVFAGRAQRPYVESDLTGASCARGRALQRLEHALQAAGDPALIVRTGPLLDPLHPRCPVRSALQGPGASALDEIVSPTMARHALDALLDLLLDGERGVWHLANEGAVTLRELVARLVHAPLPAVESGAAAAAPAAQRALASERGPLLPPLERVVAEYSAACEVLTARDLRVL